MGSGNAHVAVCIVTYRRTAGLTRLLKSLAEQCFSGPCPQVEVIVVDNDANGSAREVCEREGAGAHWPLRYAVEPDRGISQARNRAVTLALRAADFVAFIDDDEVPVPAWLDELLACEKRTAADVVWGPAVPHFSESPPEWVMRGRFFEAPRFANDAELLMAATGGVLIHRRVFERMTTWFDPRWGLVGGGDSLFFARVRQAGFRIVWADRAEVAEWISASHVTARWLLQRSFRNGNGHTRRELVLDPRLRTRLTRAAKAAVHLLLAVVSIPAGSWLGRHAWVGRLRSVCFFSGSLAAVCGYAYPEYRLTAR
jgi:glycosyltransferase involved in cell wall biosynthesis